MNKGINESKNILISGAAGFLGSRVVQALCKQGYNVTGIARNKEEYLPFAKSQNFKWLIRDISYSPITTEEASNFDTVIHLAGATEGRGDDRLMHVLANEMTTVGLTNHDAQSIKKFIYASSQVVYGNPGSKCVDESGLLDFSYSNYATSKINSENWLKLYQSKTSNMTLSLRLCGFIDGGGLIDTLINECLKGSSSFELFSYGNICRDYIHSSFFIELILRLLSLEPISEFCVLNVGLGQEMSALQLASLVKEYTNSSLELILSEKSAKKNDLVYNINKLVSKTDLRIPLLSDAILDYLRFKMSANPSPI